MDHRLRILTALLGVSLAHADIPSAYKSGVLIVENADTPSESGTGGVGASIYVGEHYRVARGIPAENVCQIHYRGDLDPHAYDAWDISHSDYISYVRTPVAACITALGASNIRWIVTTYGVPSNILQVNSSFEVSVDSMLTLAHQSATCPSAPGTLLQCSNTYTAAYSTRVARIWNFEGLNFPFNYRPLIVGRLDGPSAVIAAALVDKAIAAEVGISKKSGIGYFDWQGAQPAGNTSDGSMKRAYDLCVSAGLRCVLNNQSTSGGLIASAPNTLWAWGWYSGASVNDVYTFAPGAIGSQLTSYTANCIRVNCTGSYAPIWLTKGITAFWGVTGEPTTAFYPPGDIVLNHIWMGYTIGESFTMATSLLNWMPVLIGDPLYTPVLRGPSTSGGMGRSGGLSSF